MSVLVLCYCWFYGISMIITKVTIGWWIICVCKLIYAQFISPDNFCQVVSSPRSNIAMFRLFGGSMRCHILLL